MKSYFEKYTEYLNVLSKPLNELLKHLIGLQSIPANYRLHIFGRRVTTSGKHFIFSLHGILS
jgi:hypothetical protein